MSDLQHRILRTLDEKSTIPDTLSEFPEIDPQNVLSALNSLVAKAMVEFTKVDIETWDLTPEGAEIVDQGSHEYILLQKVTESLEGLKISEVGSVLGANGKLGQARAFKNGWITKDGSVLKSKFEKDALPEDTTAAQLTEIKQTGGLSDKKALGELKKRKLIVLNKKQSFNVHKGPSFSLTIKQLETDLTIDMLTSGAWKDAEFKPYNFQSEGVAPTSGALHPLMKVREEFRQIFFSLGFTEMPSNQYVESGFWNFDALFVPQQHPARDLQDTFYIKDPKVAKPPSNTTYLENTKKVHQDGAYDSIGYRYPWKIDESLRMVLRTHTTAVSAKLLHDLAQNPGPVKLFSIDRVFRNEAVDATHLAEFHQVEGVIADYNLTLGDLIQFMRDFFAKMGVHNLRFKPTYNPYTEPSMEVFSWHQGLGKWVEIGNSGMFRPEMLETMGLPKNLRGLGFGLSLERPTMIKYGVSNIRELLGHKVSLDFIETNPAARFDEDIFV